MQHHSPPKSPIQGVTPLQEPLSSQMLGCAISLDQRLGAGSSGEVWLATLSQTPGVKLPAFLQAVVLPPTFAVKIVRGDQLTSPRHLQLVQQEIASIKALRHPYIVRYLTSWIERNPAASKYDGCLCIATEHCAGGDLRRLIHKRRERHQHFTNEAVMWIAGQLLSACAYCHAHKVLHRDVKPANIFVKSGADGIILGDFGLARSLEHTQDAAASRVGTANYCSPQVVMGEAYTAKTDVWSVGVVLYEVMTLQRPFFSPTNTEGQVFERIVLDDPIPSLRALCEGQYSNTLINMVDACLCKQESQRPSAVELLTTFSTTFGAFVKRSGIPVVVGPTAATAAAARVSPVRKASSPLPERTASPLRGGSKPSAHLGSPIQPQPQPQRASPLRGAAPTATSPLAKKFKDPHAGTSPPSMEQVSSLLSTLLEGTTVSATTAPDASTVMKALHNDDELFLLVKLMLLTRQGKGQEHVEDGLFKLLVALRPEVDADKVIRLVVPKAGG